MGRGAGRLPTEADRVKQHVVTSIDYEARRGENRGVEIVVTIEGIGFREERITHGHLAGMIGHCEIPTSHETIFNLHPEQARRLRDQLDELLRWG